MKSKHAFIVHLPKRFNDTIEVAGIDLYIDPKFREFENRVCQGVIVSTPSVSSLRADAGDILYFHHHVVMNTQLALGNDLYLVPYHRDHGYNSQAYAYQRGTEVTMIDEWVFLKAHEATGFITNSSGIMLDAAIVPKELKGVVAYGSAMLDLYEVSAGDTVGFNKNSDYEMIVNGERVWRMRVSDIDYVERV